MVDNVELPAELVKRLHLRGPGPDGCWRVLRPLEDPGSRLDQLERRRGQGWPDRQGVWPAHDGTPDREGRWTRSRPETDCGTEIVLRTAENTTSQTRTRTRLDQPLS